VPQSQATGAQRGFTVPFERMLTVLQMASDGVKF